MKALAWLVILAGCSPDVDLSGVYLVTSDVGSSPCGNDQPVLGAPTYVKWSQDSFIGSKYWGYGTCTDASGTTCSGGPSFLVNPLGDALDDGWQGEEYTSSDAGSGSTECTLGYTLAKATLAGTTLTYDVTTFSGDVAAAPDDCTPDAAKAMKATLGCEMHEQMIEVRQ